MTATIKPMREWRDVTPELFRNEICASREPAVMRGLVGAWPLVERGRQSSSAAAQYLNQLYNRKPIGTIRMPASARGRVFYNEAMSGYNFERTMQDLRVVLHDLLQAEAEDAPATIAVQAVGASEHLPGFEADHVMPLAPGVVPRLWIGNAAVIAPHYDLFDNIACVAIGRRRFTLFPPEQLANLYVGPVDNTPSGAPVSLVDMNDPDLERFPKYADALESAVQAELGPGDAIFIPYMWWHGVEALDRFNILVNYWWDDHAAEAMVPPRVAMMIARLAFAGMSPEQLGRWRAMFDHYIFGSGEHPMAHVPEHARGLFGDLSPQQKRAARQHLARLLTDI
jgi:hypothetical protein